MTIDKAAAIAASAYNVCGPRSGVFATPATVGTFDRSAVADCLAAYETAHDGELFTTAEIAEALAIFSAS